LTIGAVSSFTSDDNEKQSLSRGYTIDTTTPLGVTLQWVSSFFFVRSRAFRRRRLRHLTISWHPFYRNNTFPQTKNRMPFQ
jgi:hypothetical protein